MLNDDQINVLARVARSRATGAPALAREDEATTSILSLAAASYGAKPSDDATVPTGFDPVAVALFEAIVEGAFLVASADGVFDAEEKQAFERVVVAACGGAVGARQVTALVSDLGDQLQEDGLSRRISMVGRHVQREEHAREVLRISALLAMASEDVSAIERDVLTKLAEAMKLAAREVDRAIDDVKGALASPTG